MALRVIGGKKSTMTKDDLFKFAKDYNDISLQMKSLDKQKKSLADKIKELAQKFGTKDDKGSHYCGNDEFMCGNVAKHSVSLDTDKAIKLLQKKGLNDLIEEKIVKTVDEKKLEKAVMDGTITNEEFNSIMNDKVSYSVLVKKVEEMPEVEVSHLMAARKK